MTVTESLRGRAADRPPRGAIFKDPRVRSVEWRDLVEMSRREIFVELTLSLPWLLLSVASFHLAGTRSLWWMTAGLFASFYFFLTGLRQVHNAHHYAIGISKGAHDWLMWALSVLMMSSMHAIQVTHLHHHRHCLADEDVEASSSKIPWYQALYTGPLFFVRLHYHAFKIDKRRRKRGWILFELASMAVWTGLVFGFLDFAGLKTFVVAMLVGQCLTGFFAVWTVHHHCDDHSHIARTQRGRIKNFISYNMFFHVEHHLYPAVPTCHQPELARRLDEAAPELKEKNVY